MRAKKKCLKVINKRPENIIRKENVRLLVGKRQMKRQRKVKKKSWIRGFYNRINEK